MYIIQKLLIFVNGDILMSGEYGVSFDLFESVVWWDSVAQTEILFFLSWSIRIASLLIWKDA